MLSDFCLYLRTKNATMTKHIVAAQMLSNPNTAETSGLLVANILVAHIRKLEARRRRQSVAPICISRPRGGGAAA